MVCLQGASGSGKSTLLAIIGCVFPCQPAAGRPLPANNSHACRTGF
jgi:ABC-type lipoprotein export system ATPase subunit